MCMAEVETKFNTSSFSIRMKLFYNPSPPKKLKQQLFRTTIYKVWALQNSQSIGTTFKKYSGVWKPTYKFQLKISNEYLNVWPEEGDLTILNPDLHIYDSKDDEIIEP